MGNNPSKKLKTKFREREQSTDEHNDEQQYPQQQHRKLGSISEATSEQQPTPSSSSSAAVAKPSSNDPSATDPATNTTADSVEHPLETVNLTQYYRPTNTTVAGTTPGPPGSGTTHQQPFDIDEFINRLLDVGYSTKVTKSVCLKNSEITAISLAAREVLLSQPTLIELSPPVKIVGDVHGQYSDLISLETILLLLCYKIKYPENFFLLRGNHECANVTRVYGFYDECKRRCNIKIWKTFIDVFNCLPISAVVASKIFCVHGGLSPSLSSMDDIRRIQRPTDVPDFGLLNDLLWSDPSDTATDWEDNERGVSYCFGKSVIAEFLTRYDFDLICRAHMVVEDGYEFWNERTLVTIFSAPNYCGEFDNFGAVMSVSEDLLCAFELLKPLDGAALKKEMQKKNVPGGDIFLCHEHHHLN
ncbi:hypothetical protein H4Q26_002867 [Puccinia striiformis f. sp. tritici PST-130]|nr:hypothetical protein H4Q26_002867 [Puccinia striiformis f. sp. tritici PST-130]